MYIESAPNPDTDETPGPIITTENRTGRERADCWLCGAERKAPATNGKVDGRHVPMCRDCLAEKEPRGDGFTGPTLRVGEDCPLDLEPGDYE